MNNHAAALASHRARPILREPRSLLRGLAWAGPAVVFQAMEEAGTTVAVVSDSAARLAVSRLLSDRYGWRGYGPPTLPPEGARQFRTLGLQRGATWVATLTVGWGADATFACEARCPEAVAQLRARGQALCEFTRLASSLGAVTDAGFSALQQLTALFCAAALTGLEAGCDTALIEVNPRHVGFYRRVTGARAIAAARHHEGADAPAVPMAIDLERLRERVLRLRRTPQAA